MLKWTKLAVLVLLVLVAAMAIQHFTVQAGTLVAHGGDPVPPPPFLVAHGGDPCPPPPYLAVTSAPQPARP